ncbi:MAG: CBS domain-containing protein [bacterium]|jgi:CBS domain-containing protein|nr:CBS domain-containing protein [bacterium]MDD4558716.1 CBS domain-containing protein [bacterium]
MDVGDIMTKNVTRVLPQDNLQKAAALMKDSKVGCLVVAGSAKAIGILTDRDLAVRALAQDWLPHEHNVSEVMTANPITINQDSDIMEAARLIGRNRIRRLPVTDDKNNLVGLVSEADVTEYIGQALTDIFGELTKAEK